MITIYFRGFCQPNKNGGKMSYGSTIYHNGKEIYKKDLPYKRDDGIASNHIADYCGLVSALRFLISKGLTKEQVYCVSDSQLVVKQMMREYEINDGKYKEYARQAIKLLKYFDMPPYFEWRQIKKSLENINKLLEKKSNEQEGIPSAATRMYGSQQLSYKGFD